MPPLSSSLATFDSWTNITPSYRTTTVPLVPAAAIRPLLAPQSIVTRSPHTQPPRTLLLIQFTLIVQQLLFIRRCVPLRYCVCSSDCARLDCCCRESTLHLDPTHRPPTPRSARQRLESRLCLSSGISIAGCRSTDPSHVARRRRSCLPSQTRAPSRLPRRPSCPTNPLPQPPSTSPSESARSSDPRAVRNRQVSTRAPSQPQSTATRPTLRPSEAARHWATLLRPTRGATQVALPLPSGGEEGPVSGDRE